MIKSSIENHHYSRAKTVGFSVAINVELTVKKEGKNSCTFSLEDGALKMNGGSAFSTANMQELIDAIKAITPLIDKCRTDMTEELTKLVPVDDTQEKLNAAIVAGQ